MVSKLLGSYFKLSHSIVGEKRQVFKKDQQFRSPTLAVLLSQIKQIKPKTDSGFGFLF